MTKKITKKDIEYYNQLLDGAEYTSQVEALMTLLRGENTFVSGVAGAGKSYVLQVFRTLCQDVLNKKVLTLSSTGISAVNIGGKTVNSVFRTLAKNSYDEDEALYLSGDSDIKKSWKGAEQNLKGVDVVIIDEVSMISEKLFDYIYKTLKRAATKNRRKVPQVIVLGDFSQLPPVGQAGDPSSKNFCYGSESWNNLNFKTLFMDKSYRAEDIKLKILLESITSENREKAEKIISKLKTSKEGSIKGSIYLTSTNKDADVTNKSEQDRNPNKAIIFETLYGEEGLPKNKAKPEDLEEAEKLGIPDKIVLKDGDTVMVTENNPESSAGATDVLMNGTIGILSYDEKNKLPSIILEDGRKVVLTDRTTKKIEDEKLKEVEIDGEKTFIKTKTTKAVVHYYPLKLAYAISIHKSQGQTFSNIYINLFSAWMPNLGYVALSRATTFDGIILKEGQFSKVLGSKSLEISPESKQIKLSVLENAKKTKEDDKDLNLETFKEWVKKVGRSNLVLPKDSAAVNFEDENKTIDDVVSEHSSKIKNIETELEQLKNIVKELIGRQNQ